MSLLLASVASAALLAVVFVPLERLFAARSQPVLRQELWLDAVFFLGQYLLWNGASVAVLRAITDLLGVTRVALPWWLLALVAVLAGDLLVYWFHRACHTFEPLWRIHAVHHSSERLDWVAAHREHPLDGLLTQLCQNLPAILLGVSLQGLAALVVLRSMWAIFVHSNVRLPLGPLGFLLGDPALHHWHHARSRSTTHNFANLAPWLDWLFGTHHRPQSSDYELGLSEPSQRGYLAWLVSPLRSRR